MACAVVLTQQAQDDLQNIVCFIARDNRERARTFGNTLIDKALALASFPERGRIVPEVNDPQVREIIHRDYRIIYELFADPRAVFILRFWHAARGKPEVSKID